MKNMSLIDLHCDTFWQIDENSTKQLYKNDLCVDIKKLQQADSVAQFFACFIYITQEGDMRYAGSYEKALRMIKRAREEFSQNENDLVLATNYEQLKGNIEEGKISAFLTIEEGGILEGKLERLEELYGLGIRLMTLLWNYENCIGFPNSRDDRIMSSGLTAFGFEVIERMQSLGMLIDVSHLSDGGFYDVTRHAKRPFVASHSNARALCNHPRNLTDHMIKTLAEAGGVAGINFYPYFLQPTGVATAEDLVNHICHMMNVGGEEVVAIGTDFDGFDEGTLDMRHIGEIDRLLNAMKRRGITERQIDKIFCENALRVIREGIR